MKVNVIRDFNSGDVLNDRPGIGFTDDETWIARNKTGWSMIVGRDIIVPVMNIHNRLKDSIAKKGITPENLSRMMQIQDKDDVQNLFTKCFVVNEASVVKGVEKFLKTNNLKSKGIEIVREEEIVSAIEKNSNAMGFCRLSSITKPDGQSLPENIALVTVDKNNNGKIDYMEDIYDNLQTFERGVWIGKYPKALTGKIYVISTKKPVKETELAFLKWVLTDGQLLLNNFGYTDLVLNERQTQLAKIQSDHISIQARGNQFAWVKRILAVLLVLGAVALILRLITGITRTRKKVRVNVHTRQIPVFDEDSMVIPKGLFFDKTHTWAFMKKDGTVKVGIDDFLQHVTGKITRIDLRKTGDKIKKGEHLLTLVQKGKQLDIYSPVSGTIREKNKSLTEYPSLINISPYKEGWTYSIEPKNWPVEMQFLSMAGKYKTELKKEFQRLKDFLVSAVKANENGSALVLQDGGALKDNLLEELGPEVWDDFQTKFIDISIH